MTPLPLFLAALLYVWAAAGYAIDRNWPMALAFACYAAANVGFAVEGAR